MTDEQIIEMLKDIIRFIDYDIYKYFFENEEEDVDLDPLMKISREHIKFPRISEIP